MARRSTGTVDWRWSAELQRHCWHGRWTRGDGSRTPWHALDPEILETDEAAAHECAARFAPIAKATTKDGKGELVASYATRWLASRAPKTRTANASHLTHHVLDVIGHRAILALTSADGDALVAELDAKIKAGTMSAKTARNVWGTAKKMLRDAAHAKPATGLRCLEANPFRDVAPPERTHVKQAKQFLYPSEFLALMSHPRVPTSWKANIAVAVFLGLRDGEQRALRWAHVDLEHAVVNVCETFDKLAKAVRAGTKTDAARTVPIPAPLMPLLRTMRDAADGAGLVCRGLASPRAMARGLRTWLRTSGVKRAALHESTAVNMNIRWHDLRATCGTWLAVEGRNATEIRDRLGHTDIKMTDRYLRDATAVRAGSFGRPFPELPQANRHRSDMTKLVASNVAIEQALLRGGRDSNPRPPA
jgi:integrase